MQTVQILTADLLPQGACAVELYIPTVSQSREEFSAQRRRAQLHPQERKLICNAVDRRQQEFADGRWCAHQALVKLGVDLDRARAPIGRGPHGMPLFPQGVAGSITHTTGEAWAYRAAIVRALPAGVPLSVGVDAEPAKPLPAGILERIASGAEQSLVLGDPVAARVLFSIKETVFKVCFPLSRVFLEFDQAEVEILDSAGHGGGVGRWQARVTGVPGIESVSGRWSIRQGVIVTTGWASSPVRLA